MIQNNAFLNSEITLNIDSVCFMEKPRPKEDVPGIRRRLAKGTTNITPSNLKRHIERGGSFTPAAMSGTQGSSWKSQQMIVVDVDNDEPVTDKEGHAVKGKKKPVDHPLSSEEALYICREYGIEPSFMYHTFSNTPELEKYRIGCILDQPVDSAAEGVDLTARLADLLNTTAPGAADTSMADAARLVYGSTSGSIFYDSELYTSIEALRALPKSTKAVSMSRYSDAIVRDENNFIMPTNTGLENIQLYQRCSWFQEWTEKHNIEILRTVEKDDGTMIYGVVCPWSDQHSDDTGELQSAVIIRPNGVIQYVCQHSHCREKKWSDFRAYYEKNEEVLSDVFTESEESENRSGIAVNTSKSALLALIKDIQPEYNNRYRWSDIGNGNLFADVYKDAARYCPDRGVWFVYDGKRWRPDSKDFTQTMRLCKRLADALMIYSTTIENEKYAQAVAKWQNRNTRNTILKDAQDCYPVNADEFDADDYLLNCKNGTLDFREMKFRPHDPADMISKIANVYYDPEAYCERWDSFISEIMEHEQGKTRFLQKAYGYSLIGDTREECFFILYGATSRNGKSVLNESFKNIMGDYGRATSPESIAQKDRTDSSRPNEDIARLAGARFVNISEPDKSLVLSSALIKTLTGNDTIQARYLHEHIFEFRPQFTIFINTNHLPRVTDSTVFSSDRIKVIPFTRHFEENERDTGLKRLFSKKENASAILNWCIKGLRMYQDEGLTVPDSVKAATKEYMNDSDDITRFMDDELISDFRSEERTADVYDRYKEWCERNGFHQKSIKTFSQDLKQRNVTVLIKRPVNGGNPCSVIIAKRLS